MTNRQTLDTAPPSSLQLVEFPLVVSISGNGTVTSSDGFINCPGTCNHEKYINALIEGSRETRIVREEWALTLLASPAISNTATYGDPALSVCMS